MKFDGIIKSWNDERGFGFIEPTQGGQEIFVHIKAFRSLRGRPQPEQRVTFAIELDSSGKKRARDVEFLRARKPGRSTSGIESRAQWGTATLFVIPLFLVGLVVAYFVGNPPRWVLGLYAVASVVTFFAYAFDKSAARQGFSRTAESTLHLLALVGGWPGALVAQQLLRHKSVKAEFRSAFWGTVVLNVAAFVVLSTPIGRNLLHV